MHFLPALLLACTPLLDAPRAYDSISSTRIIAADVDADGAPDVVTSGPSGIAVLYGRNGTLSAPAVLTNQPLAAFVADVDGDTLPDIIATESFYFDERRDTLVLRNLGQRRFATGAVVASEPRPAIAVADFTSDGRPDILIPRESRNGLLLRNDGRGHFASEETSVLEVDGAAVGDVDADGKLDLVQAHASQRVAIQRGDGNGRFTRQFLTFWSPVTAALVDLNRDDRADLVAMFETTGDLLVYRSPIDLSQPLRSAAGAPHALTPGDFDADGTLDVAVLARKGTRSESAPRVHVFLNPGNGMLVRSDEVFIGPEAWHGGLSPKESIATADFNGDGVLDLVVPDGESRVGLVLGRGDGTFATPNILQARKHTRLESAIDLNGDGIDELLATDDATGFVTTGVQKDDGTYHFETLPAAGGTFAAGDPNEHGWRTMLIANRGDLSVWSRSIDGVWTSIRSIAGPTYGVASEDLDGDGKREIVVVNDRRLRVLDPFGNERFSTETGGAAQFRIFIADVNRDARPDLIVARRGSESPVPHPPIYSDGFIDVYLGRGDATFAAPKRIVDETLVETVMVGDFNGDANVDILASDDWVLRLFRGDGRGGFTRSPRAPFDGGLAADFNGDGIMDVLAYGNTLVEGTRGWFVHRGSYVLDSDHRGLALARRAQNARPTVVGVTGTAGEVYLVDVLCGGSRTRAVRR